MAAASLGRLTLDVVAKVGSFVQGMTQAERKAKESSDNMKKSFKSFGDQIQDTLGGTQIGSAINGLVGKLGLLNGNILVATGALGGMAVGGVGLATLTASKFAIELGKADFQLQTLANRANTTAGAFSTLSGVSSMLGIDQQKLSDILADTQEKLGEFSATEGGEASDFFDALKNNTKMTDDQIKAFGKTLQGKDGIGAIQAISNKLDELDVSKQERRFIFESLASDLGDLAPIFAENGKLIKEYDAALEEAGVKRTDEARAKTKLLAAQQQEFVLKIQGVKNKLADEVAPTLLKVSDYFLQGFTTGGKFSAVLEVIGGVAKAAGSILVGFASIVKSLISLMGGAFNTFGNLGETLVNFWNAPTLLGKGQALAQGFQRNGEILATSFTSAFQDIKNGYDGIKSIWSDNPLEAKGITKTLLEINNATLENSEGLRINTKEAKENEKASKKQTEAKARLAKEQENLNKMVGASALTGLRIKSSEAFAGGNVRAYTASFAQMSQTALGKELSRFTAFNDLYHKGTNSKHATGNAFDFTIADAKKSGEAVSQLESIAKRYGYVVKILDEYRNPSKRATGGHIHVSVLGFNGTAQMQKDAQAELDIIGKTNEEALKIQEERAKKQMSIALKLGGDLNKIEAENQESISEIKQAFTENDPNRAKYLQLQELMYKKDLEAFRKTEQQKRSESFAAVYNPMSDMQSIGINALAQTSLSPLQYEQWQLQQDQQGGYSQLGDSYTLASNAINDNEKLSAEEKYAELESLHEAYLQNKAALSELYAKQEVDLQNNQQASSLAGYSAMFGVMGSLLENYGDKQSTAYRVAFAAQKGFAVASALMNAKGAILSAWNDSSATSIWQKMANVAAVAIQTNELMSAIQGVALAGQAHNGIDNIPREGTWLLDGGERVLNPQQNKDLTNYLANKSQGDTPTVNVYTLPGETAEVSWNNGELDVRIRKVSEQHLASQLQNPNSMSSKAIKQNFNTTQKR